jgi:alkaline phosphatase D
MARLALTSRRRVLAGAGALLGSLAAAKLAWPDSVVRDPSFSSDPFSLGVASGDPFADSVVLWTRLAPAPLEGGGMPAVPVEVRWEIASDEQMRRVVRTGTAIATPELAHSVHVTADGLEPTSWYWYRFGAGSATSPVGRTRTAPVPGSATDQLRFAFASCQHWMHGYYAAYRDIAASDLDLVVFLGDYIYEGGILPGSGVRDAHDVPVQARIPATTLDEYRRRYALYKLDPDLQAAHHRFPWVVTWDDHEVSDDYASDLPGAGSGSEEFLIRRAAAYQAAYEHQPFRVAAPDGPGLRIYRRFAFGDLVDLAILDTRQYRSKQVSCSPAERAQNGGYCRASLDPSRTLLGAEQKRWLLDGLATSKARWSVIGNQVPFARRNFGTVETPSFGGAGDKWDGYTAERDEILRAIAGNVRGGVGGDVVFITGDLHENYVFDIPADWNDPASPTVATEFVGTAISSEGHMRGTRHTTTFGPTTADPRRRLHSDHNGYVRCVARREWLEADFRVVATAWERDAAVTTLASFTVARGAPGARLAAAR